MSRSSLNFDLFCLYSEPPSSLPNHLLPFPLLHQTNQDSDQVKKVHGAPDVCTLSGEGREGTMLVTVLIQAGLGGKIERTGSTGAREMTQWSQVCTALAEGPHFSLAYTHIHM